jgi:hypothetical protein
MTRTDIRSEDVSEVRDSLNQVVNPSGLRFDNRVSNSIARANNSSVHNERSSVVDVGEIIAVVGKHIGLLNREPMSNTSANRLREAAKIRSTPLALRETTVVDKIGGIGNEVTIVLPEVATRHLDVIPSTVDKTFEIKGSIATTSIEVRIAEGDLLLELTKVRIRVRTSRHTRHVLPSITSSTSIADSPFDSIAGSQLRTIREHLDILEERFEAQSINSEDGSIATTSRRHTRGRGILHGRKNRASRGDERIVSDGRSGQRKRKRRRRRKGKNRRNRKKSLRRLRRWRRA